MGLERRGCVIFAAGGLSPHRAMCARDGLIVLLALCEAQFIRHHSGALTVILVPSIMLAAAFALDRLRLWTQVLRMFLAAMFGLMLGGTALGNAAAASA